MTWPPQSRGRRYAGRLGPCSRGRGRLSCPKVKPQQWPAHWSRPVQSTCPSPSRNCPSIAPTLCPCPVLSRNSLCFLGWGVHSGVPRPWDAALGRIRCCRQRGKPGPGHSSVSAWLPPRGQTASPQPSLLHPCLPRPGVSLLAGEDKGTVLADQLAPAQEGRAQGSRAETPLGRRPQGPCHSSRTGGASPRASRPLRIAGKETGAPWEHEGPHN